MKNKNILFLSSTYGKVVGGVETVTSSLIDFFKEKEYNVFVFSGTDAEIDSFIQKNSIGIVINQGIFSQYRKNRDLKDVIVVGTLHSMPFYEVMILRYEKLHTQIFKEKNRLRKIKLFFRFFINKVFPFVIMYFSKRFYRNIISGFDYFVVLDDTYKKELENKLYGGKKNDKIVVIPNGIKTYSGVDYEKENTVLFAGRLDYCPKRVDRLLEIWYKFSKNKKDWSLKIIGDGVERKNLERLVGKMHLNNVSFEGFRDPSVYYNKASVICLTSDYEGQPMSIIEAMSKGVIPVIYNSFSAAENIIDNGKNGFLVDYLNEPDFVKKLVFIAENSNKDALRMRRNAVEKSKFLNIEKVGNKWIDLFLH